jgi:hypothetical protein
VRYEGKAGRGDRCFQLRIAQKGKRSFTVMPPDCSIRISKTSPGSTLR